jgi:hypothetical protein
MKDPVLGFTYYDNGKTTIDSNALRMFASAKLRTNEPLLETDLDPGGREIAETGVAALRALDTTLSSLLSLATELETERGKPKPAPQQITRTRFVERDARVLLVATDDRDSSDE